MPFETNLFSAPEVAVLAVGTVVVTVPVTVPIADAIGHSLGAAAQGVT